MQTKETRYVASWGFTVGLKRVNGGSVKRKPKRVTDEARQITMELRNKYKHSHLRVPNLEDSEVALNYEEKRNIVETNVKTATDEMLACKLDECNINSMFSLLL